jgi:hypothetical protein
MVVNSIPADLRTDEEISDKTADNPSTGTFDDSKAGTDIDERSAVGTDRIADVMAAWAVGLCRVAVFDFECCTLWDNKNCFNESISLMGKMLVRIGEIINVVVVYVPAVVKAVVYDPVAVKAVEDVTTVGKAVVDVVTVGKAEVNVPTVVEAVVDVATVGKAVVDVATVGEAAVSVWMKRCC